MSLSDPKNSCRRSHETRMTRDSKGQETPLDSNSKSRIDAPIHQDKKTSQIEAKNLWGVYNTSSKDLLSMEIKYAHW